MKYLNRLTLDMRHNRSPELNQLFGNDRYVEHQHIWSVFDFDPDVERDFLYRRENSNGSLQYYVLSSRPPSEDNPAWKVESRPYHPRLSQEQKLQFLVRVNPVVKRRDKNGKQQRHDVVMDAKLKTGWKEHPPNERPDWYELVLDSCLDWLTRRGPENGFELVPHRMTANAYTRNCCYRRKQKQMIRFSSVDLSGVMTVTDVQRFEQMLFKGLGPEKSFGCGLVLIKVARHVATP